MNIEFYDTPKVWRGRKSEDKKQGSDGVVNMSVRQEVVQDGTDSSRRIKDAN